MTFDILVLGAGPAGASAAYTAARAGLSVALIDKAAFPREKLCGGGFTGRSYRYFEEIYGAPIPARLIETHHSASFYANGELLSVLEDIPPIHLTMRRGFDAEMCARALAAGAADYTGQRITRVDPGAVRIELANGERLTGKVLIGADGVNSQVAKALFGQSFDRDRIGFGLEVEAPAAADNPTAPLRIDFEAAQWGYGWLFPKSGSSTIGVGGVLSKNTDMKAEMADYLALLGHDPEMPVKGHFLPFGDFRKRPGRGPVLLAGDAAGLVDPITGEGIAYAMKSGQLAAQAAVAAIKAGRPDSALTRYTRALKPIHSALRQANMIRQIIFSGPLRRGFHAAFRRSGTIRHLYMRLMAGEIEYATVATATLKRLPGFLLRALRP
ncbi:geranylgeranyl reductase family protein [Pseudooceanicola sp. CBS1P-1]|uniref:Geranylgeranyl reductase family protein n=1 Tax=Pseudooceanicola albus TaxID=2692189 RepID=A0A6L7G6T2_9RHOB|nr:MULTISPECIES: geranylgeranyl reductase family protein [Pseudooceanicola]MBT9384672.1 geranylgeranyl reductase family protein [Pseudooceanicola endophyticus]MXN18373.1 geranylgeranyl reductase family protein [Pseudooceanicola albus]